MKVVILISVLAVVLGCRGKVNPNPIVNASFEKVEVHPYGQKHVFTIEDQTIYLLKLHGSAYQAGVAYGSLMSKEIKALIHDLWTYYESIAEQQFKFILKLPTRLQPLGRKFAIRLYKELLMANYAITRIYTPRRFMDQMAGISKGAGVALEHLIHLNMIPQYTRAGCSILGTWGKATLDGDFIQLRALDWDVNNPMNKYPVIVVYDFKEPNSVPFINMAWAGFVGSITGFSAYVGGSEKVRKQNPVKENQTRYGKPWMYAFRDMLQFSKNIDNALQSLAQTKRTCSIYLGVSSTTDQTFRLIEYSHKEFTTYDDHNFPYTSNHLQMDGVVFMPIHDNDDSCFNDLLKAKYGSINEDWIVNTLAPLHKTGDTQMAAWNYNKKVLLFQVSLNKRLAFQKPMIKINLQGMFTSRYNDLNTANL